MKLTTAGEAPGSSDRLVISEVTEPNIFVTEAGGGFTVKTEISADCVLGPVYRDDVWSKLGDGAAFEDSSRRLIESEGENQFLKNQIINFKKGF